MKLTPLARSLIDGLPEHKRPEARKVLADSIERLREQIEGDIFSTRCTQPDHAIPAGVRSVAARAKRPHSPSINGPHPLTQ